MTGPASAFANVLPSAHCAPPAFAAAVLSRRGTFWGEGGWFRIERGRNTLLIESSCSYAVPTFDELDDYLHGAQSGSVTGLQDIPAEEQWSHVPRKSEASDNFVQRLRGAAAPRGGVGSGSPGVAPSGFAVAGVLGLIIALATVGAMVLRRQRSVVPARRWARTPSLAAQRIFRAEGDDDGLRTSMVSGVRHDEG